MRKKKNLVLLLALLLLSFLILFAGSLGPFYFLNDLTQKAAAPPKRLLYALKTKLAGKDSRELQKLRKENRELYSKAAEIVRIKRDNDALRSQFETNTTKQFKLLPSNIVGFLGGLSTPTSFIIDAGKKDSVKEGMTVIFQNNLLGKIASASDSFSQVALVYNQGFSVLVNSETGVLGVVRGQGDFFLLEHVSVSEVLQKGQILTTKGEINNLGWGIPNDLIVGKISSISRDPQATFQTAKIESLVNFSKLTKVFIVLGLN